MFLQAPIIQFGINTWEVGDITPTHVDNSSSSDCVKSSFKLTWKIAHFKHERSAQENSMRFAPSLCTKIQPRRHYFLFSEEVTERSELTKVFLIIACVPLPHKSEKLNEINFKKIKNKGEARVSVGGGLQSTALWSQPSPRELENFALLRGCAFHFLRTQKTP